MENICLQPRPEKEKKIWRWVCPKSGSIAGRQEAQGQNWIYPTPYMKNPNPPWINPIQSQPPKSPINLPQYKSTIKKGKGGRDQRKEKTDSSRASPNWSLSKQLKLLIP